MPDTVVIVELVPVSVGAELVAVTVVAVPARLCVVKTTVAIPSEFVVEVAKAKDPLVLDLLQVTTFPAVATGLPSTSASWAVMVTVEPAAGE